MKLKSLILSIFIMSASSFLYGETESDPFFYPEFKDNYCNIDDYIKSFPFRKYTVCQAGPFSYYIDYDIVKDKQKDGIKTHLKNGIVWESHIVDCLRQYITPGTLVIDIGAHIGTLTLEMSSIVGHEGRVIGFEPQLKIFRELYYNLLINKIENVQIMRYALGDENKRVQMNLTAAENEGGTGIGQGGESVDMVTLDKFNFSNISLLKIDVEGFEDQVLIGAKETILRNKPIILIEIMGGNIYSTASPEVRNRIDHTISLLESYNYKVSNLYAHDYLGIPQ